MITYGKLVEKINKLRDLGFSDDDPIQYSYILDKILKDEVIALDELLDLSTNIQQRIYARIRADEHALDVCSERLTYISKYLSGTMYQSQAAPSEQDLIQFNNALAAVNAIKEANGGGIFKCVFLHRGSRGSKDIL